MNNQELQADLAKVAAEYNHSVLQQGFLENYRDSILLLRAKYASFERITELLNERGIKVSVATVIKFCRKYRDESQRLREEIAADVSMESQEIPATTTQSRDDRQPPTSRGEIAAVHVHDTYESTLKHVLVESNQVRLRASNPNYQDIIVPASDWRGVAGVFRGLVLKTIRN